MALHLGSPGPSALWILQMKLSSDLGTSFHAAHKQEMNHGLLRHIRSFWFSSETNTLFLSWVNICCADGAGGCLLWEQGIEHGCCQNMPWLGAVRGEGLSPGVGMQGWQQEPRAPKGWLGCEPRAFYIPRANLAGWRGLVNQERRVWSRKGESLGVFRGLGHVRLPVAG